MDEVKLKSALNTSFYLWVIKNDKISFQIREVHDFISYSKGGTIDVDLSQLSPEYLDKFYVTNPKKYADGFIKTLEQTVFQSLAAVKVDDYAFTYMFNYQNMSVTRKVNYYMLSKMI